MSDPTGRSGLDRRTFLKAAAVAAGAETMARHATAEPPGLAPSGGLIDVNVSLSRWPCRRLPYDETRELVAHLRQGGVAQAWAGSFDGLVHKNLAAVNARLAEDCRRQDQGMLIPFGSVNPMLPDWEEDLRRCAQEHQMPGIRLHPSYHGYKLDDAAFARLLRLAAQARLIVQLALCMEDERMMNPLLRAPAVDPTPLTELVKQTAGLRLVLLNTRAPLTVAPLVALGGSSEVYLEIAMLDGVAGVERLLPRVPLSRLCFGSHSPFYIFESAALKLKESVLDDVQLRAIRQANAARLLASKSESHDRSMAAA
jgi:predicted TIM-barrel fold metal-dependent hydrolase